MAFVAGSFALTPYARPRLLPVGRRRPDPDACARARRHARRGKRQPVRRDHQGDPPDHSAGRDRDHRRQHRHAGQRHQHDLQQHRHDRHGRTATSRSSCAKGHRPTADYVRIAARGAAGALSRRDVLVPAGRHRQPDPELRRAGADRPADPRAATCRRTSPTRRNCCAGCGTCRASPTRASSSRSTARASTSTSTARARSMPASRRAT